MILSTPHGDVSVLRYVDDSISPIIRVAVPLAGGGHQLVEINQTNGGMKAAYITRSGSVTHREFLKPVEEDVPKQEKQAPPIQLSSEEC